MRGYPITVAILMASFCVLHTSAPSAEEYNEDASQTLLPSQEVLGVLGKEVGSGTGKNLGRIVDVLVDQGGGPP